MFVPLLCYNEMQNEMYEPVRDRHTRTLWVRINDTTYTCYVCSDSLVLCRGCGGMRDRYPALFGCCSKQVYCPNCTLLIPPEAIEADSSVVEAELTFIPTLTRYSDLPHICYANTETRYRPMVNRLHDHMIIYQVKT